MFFLPEIMVFTRDIADFILFFKNTVYDLNFSGRFHHDPEKLVSVSKKTLIFGVFDKKSSKTRISKFLNIRSLLFVND